MSKIINELRDLRLVGFYAEAYYSETTGFKGVMCKSEDVELVKENYLDEYYFSGLDGKHSEVKGDLVVIDNFIEILEITSEFYIDKYCVNDGSELFENKTFETDELFEEFILRIMGLNEEFSKLNIETSTIYKITDENNNCVKVTD